MNLLDDIPLMTIVQVEEIFLRILWLVNIPFLEPFDGELHMFLATDETENIVHNSSFDTLM